MMLRSSRTSRRRSSAVAPVVLLALGVLAPSSASATKVLVLPFQCMGKGIPTDLAEQASVVITKEMAQGGLTVIQADDVAEAEKKPASSHRSPDAPTGDPSAGRKAEELISRAKEAVEASEFQSAIKELKNAVRLLEENGDAVTDLRLLPEAYLQLGVAYFRDGSEDEGDDMLNKAVHLDPERQLDAADYPPIFIRVFERARFNVLRRPRANVEVKAAKGAQVLFDGRNMGKAPIVLKEALPGNHWIRVDRPGEPVQVKKISVRAGRTITIQFEGADASEAEQGASVGVLGAIAQNELTRDHVAQLKGAGARAGADFVMIGAIYKTDTAYNIRTAYVAVKDGTVGRLTEIAFDLDMLSAEIEVYKLAEDAKKQASTGKLTNVVTEERFAIAAGLKSRSERRPTKATEETKVTMAVAAPPPPPPPQAPSAAELAEGGGAGKGRAPLSASSGRAPLGTEGERSAGAKSAPVQASLVPKDEVTPSAPARANAATEGATRAALGSTLVIPENEDRHEGGPSVWWIWVLGGLVAAGAIGAGGYFIANGRTPDEGNLRISW